MAKRIIYVMMLGSSLLLFSGCALLSTALSAGMAYGIYQVTR